MSEAKSVRRLKFHTRLEVCRIHSENDFFLEAVCDPETDDEWKWNRRYYTYLYCHEKTYGYLVTLREIRHFLFSEDAESFHAVNASLMELYEGNSLTDIEKKLSHAYFPDSYFYLKKILQSN